MLLVGALRRTLALSKGFRDLIAARNFPCAAAILRMQLDTAMRVNALLLVKEPFKLCEALFDGKRFNTFNDKAGEKLTDAYLRKQLAKKYPWVDAIYQETSDFVHLSGKHFYNTVFGVNKNTNVIDQFIAGTDPPLPDSIYFEILDAFYEVSKVVAGMLLSYFYAWANHLNARQS
jgi:hypothetical protein